MHCLEKHCVLSSLNFRVKTQKYFVSSSDMFLDRKTLLEIWLNPGLNLTIFRGTGPMTCIFLSLLSLVRCVFSEWPITSHIWKIYSTILTVTAIFLVSYLYMYNIRVTTARLD